MEREHRPVRIIILKSRKIGFSTFIEAYGHWKCQFNKHFLAKCMAHRKESADDIFEITRRFQVHLHPAVATIAPGKAKRSSRDAGVFWDHDSAFEVETQGATDADRGATPDYIHLSEVGLWWKKRRTTKDSEVLQSTLASIHDVNGTYVFLESTACGVSGAFYTRFWHAWRNETGNLFKAFFFGWQDHHKYRLKDRPGDKSRDRKFKRAFKEQDAEAFWHMASKLGYDEVWAKRAIEFNLVPAQVRWGLQVLNTKFSVDLKQFDTEFPLSPEIAFVSSSESPLPQDAITKRLTYIEENPVPFESYETADYNHRTKDIVLEEGAPRWRIYHRPQPGHEYLCVVDSAHCIEDADFADIVIADRTERVIAAAFHYRSPPDETAQQAAAMSMYYNEALLAPEVDGPGLSTLQFLLEWGPDNDGYPNLHARSMSGNWTQRWGFKMGTKARRDACVAALASALRHNYWDFYSDEFFRECRTFIQLPTGKCEAMPGTHDDMVITRAILCFLDQELGDMDEYDEPAREPAKGPPLKLVFGSDWRENADEHLGTYW